MTYKISILADAEKDLDKAYIWYELQQLNLGIRFYTIVEESIKFITNNPLCSQEIYKETRRYVIKKFPYGIYYKINSERNEIQIIGILHFKRRTSILKKRII